MIDIAILTEADIGRWVIYKPERENDKGRIKSFRIYEEAEYGGYIFVVYSCGGEWHRFKDFTGAATCPNDLSFLKTGENVTQK